MLVVQPDVFRNAFRDASGPCKGRAAKNKVGVRFCGSESKKMLGACHIPGDRAVEGLPLFARKRGHVDRPLFPQKAPLSHDSRDERGTELSDVWEALAWRHVRAALGAAAASFSTRGHLGVAKTATGVRALFADRCACSAGVGMDVGATKHRIRTCLADIGARSEQRDVVLYCVPASHGQAVANCFETDCMARRAMGDALIHFWAAMLRRVMSHDTLPTERRSQITAPFAWVAQRSAQSSGSLQRSSSRRGRRTGP